MVPADTELLGCPAEQSQVVDPLGVAVERSGLLKPEGRSVALDRCSDVRPAHSVGQIVKPVACWDQEPLEAQEGVG